MVVAYEVGEPGCAAAEVLKGALACGEGLGLGRGWGTYRVGGVDARVDDVGAGALAGAVVVDVLGGSGGAVGDTAEAPGDVRLGDDVVDGEDGVLFNVFDLERGL